MNELNLGTTIRNCHEESAADVLSMVASLRRRARTLQQRIWLLPVTLGIITILGTPLLSTRQVIQSCWLMTGTPKPISCVINHSGTSVTALTPQGIPIRGPISLSFAGRFPVIWHIGNSPWLWVIGIVVSVSLSVLGQRSSGRLRTFTITYLLAGLIGVFVLLAADRLGFPSQLSRLLTVALIICIAGFATRSQTLALVAALSFFVGIALSRSSSEFFAHLNIWIPPHSVSYLAAGLVLIGGAAFLYWHRKPPCGATSCRGGPQKIKRGFPNSFDQSHKGEWPMSDSTTPKSVISLSDAVHQRSRLAILAVLYELSRADFRLLHNSTGLSDGNLGRHIQVLEDAGLVTVEKGYSGRRPQTIVEISPEGSRALEAEVEVLKSLVSEVSKEAAKAVRVKKKGRLPSTQIADPATLLRPLDG